MRRGRRNLTQLLNRPIPPPPAASNRLAIGAATLVEDGPLRNGQVVTGRA